MTRDSGSRNSTSMFSELYSRLIFLKNIQLSLMMYLGFTFVDMYISRNANKYPLSEIPNII